MKIIISNNSLLKPLYKNIPAESSPLILSDIKCIEELKKKDFSLALVSPLIFSMIIGEEDLRIVPTKVLVIEDYSNSVTIRIKNNRERLEKIYFDNLNEYIIIVTKLVLAERFNISPVLSNSIDEADLVVNCNISNNNNNNNNNLEKNKIKSKNGDDTFTIDLTEDWYDTFEVPLVVGFWIVNAENVLSDTADNLTNSFADEELQDKELIISKNDEYQRFGYKYWVWNEKFETALEEIFDTLYYYNYAPHIADIKILNKKYENLNK